MEAVRHQRKAFKLEAGGPRDSGQYAIRWPAVMATKIRRKAANSHVDRFENRLKKQAICLS